MYLHQKFTMYLKIRGLHHPNLVWCPKFRGWENLHEYTRIQNCFSKLTWHLMCNPKHGCLSNVYCIFIWNNQLRKKRWNHYFKTILQTITGQKHLARNIPIVWTVMMQATFALTLCTLILLLVCMSWLWFQHSHLDGLLSVDHLP